MAVGDNGFMFVSYEDANIYSMLVGIEKASDSANYDNLYGYNEFYNDLDWLYQSHQMK